jgi:hypothetical protein
MNRTLTLFLLLLLVAVIPGKAAAQVSPSEVLDPTLHKLEQDYFPQLKTANQAIARLHFPFPFSLSRYVGLEPAKQVEADSRGLEFVRFQDRIVLKTTGNYNAAYSNKMFTRNERAARTFRDVILPVLQAEIPVLPQDIECDAIGFEVAYHVLDRQKDYDYEGKEILVVVLDRDDAFRMVQAKKDEERQDILNRSLIFVNGDEYGLSLLDKDPLIVDKTARNKTQKPKTSAATENSSSAAHLLHLPPGSSSSASGAAQSSTPADGQRDASGKPNLSNTRPAATEEDSARLEVKYKKELQSFGAEGQANFQFVNYDLPAFVVVNKQLALQMTLKNPQPFDAEKSSIYKRAAQTFDLFLAPKLADILAKAPDDDVLDVYDFSIVNALTSTSKERSEAIDFLIPKNVARQFVGSEITNQQLIDKSVVLVNGVRIALDLQLVE